MLRGGLHRHALDNGLRVLVVPLPHLHTVSMGLFVAVGSRHETARTNGLSHLLEHMLFRGTSHHPSSYELNLAIERLGGTLDAATQTDFTSYQVTVPPQNVSPMLDLFAEMIASPRLGGLEIEKRILREEILEELDEDGNEVDADNLVRDLLFSPHPLGLKITGSLETLQRFTVEDVDTHRQRFYGARNMVLCLAGAVDASVVEAVRRSFGRLPEGEAAQAAPPPAPLGAPRFAAVHDEGSQTDVRVSYPAPGMHDTRYAAVQVLGRILDDGLSSRLHRHLCDEQGLAYDVFASIESYSDCGVIDLGAAVEHDKTPEVLRALVELVGGLARDEVPRDELETAKQRYLWDLEAMLDDADAIASFHGTGELFDVPETLASVAEGVRSVSPGQVRDVAASVFVPAHAHAVCVGVVDKARIPEARQMVLGTLG